MPSASADTRISAARIDRLRPWLLCAGRVLLASVFVVAGLEKFEAFSATMGYMTAFHVPAPNILLPIAMVVELGGGLLLALGYRARWAAFVLLLYTLLLAFIFHSFWRYPDAQWQTQFYYFFFHLTTIGGLLYVIACGPGPLSLHPDDGDRRS